MNKRLSTDMADVNGLQRALRPKKVADFCNAQCIMDNTGFLIVDRLSHENKFDEL